MSANLLSINQFKTEFLLIGLPAQLSKIYDPSLLLPSNVTITLAQSAHNFGVMFDLTNTKIVNMQRIFNWTKSDLFSDDEISS